MEDIEKTTQKLQRSGFVQHVFNFDDSTKKYLTNSTQYVLTSLGPIILLNKGLEDLLSDFDESKGTIEVLAEVVLHIASLTTGIFFIHRIVTYLPTYSGVAYENINLFSIILSLGVILYYSSSRLGLKMKLLGERIGELWNGKTENFPVKSNSANETPGIQNNGPMLTPPVPTSNSCRADYLMKHDQMNSPSQPINNVGQNDPYGIEQPSPGQFGGMINEPMAANGVLGSAW
jgi:hypothetical protein